MILEQLISFSSNTSNLSFPSNYIQATNSLDQGYKDITSITNWSLYYTQVNLTYTQFLTEISSILTVSGFTNLSLPEQIICAQNFITTVANRNSVLSPSQLQSAAITFNNLMSENIDNNNTIAATAQYSTQDVVNFNPSTSSTSIPTYTPSNFSVPANTQVLFSVDINTDGDIIIDGTLVQV